MVAVPDVRFSASIAVCPPAIDFWIEPKLTVMDWVDGNVDATEMLSLYRASNDAVKLAEVLRPTLQLFATRGGAEVHPAQATKR